MGEKIKLTPREIVKRCIEFRNPPRIGMHFKVMPINGKTWNFTDFAGISYKEDPDFKPDIPGTDEWGCKKESFDATGENMGQVKDHPLKDWSQIDSYKFPDFKNPARYQHLAEEVVNFHEQGLYVYGHIPAQMLLPIDLRGMENWFIDHILEKENLCKLLDQIDAARLQIIEHYAAAGVDGVITWDDMGTNDRALVSPEMFRDIYLPGYRKTCDFLHDRGMHFIHHCCGQVRDYMAMFVEAGCDVIQLDQPELMGIDWLAENFGGKICFWNPVDIQKTMFGNDLKAIEDQAHRQVWQLGNFEGGFMVKAYEAPNSINLNIEKSEVQYQAFMKYSKYPLIPCV